MQIRSSSLSQAPAPSAQSADQAAEAARLAHKAYKAQTKEHFNAKEEQRRVLSGLYEGEFPAAKEETAGTKEFRLSKQLIDIFSNTPNTSPEMLANSSEIFCEDLLAQDQYFDPNADLSEKRAAFLDAKSQQAQRFNEQTPFITSDNTRGLKSKVKQHSKALKSSIQALRPGESHVFTGEYGQTRSITQGLFDLSSLLLGKNIETLPRVLKKAFKKGTPDIKTLIHTLFVIAHQKPDTWTQDPIAIRLLDLLSNGDRAKREELVEMIPDWADLVPLAKEDSAAFDKEVAQFLNFWPQKIPDAYKSRDALLKALVPVTQEPLHHALHLMLPPSLAARVAKGEAKTVDAIIKALLEDIYTHIERQVSEDKQTDIAKAIEGLLKKWNNPHITSLLGENAITAQTLAGYVEALKKKKAESPAAFGEELGRIALSMSGGLKHDPHRFLHTLVDTNLEGIITNLLELIPSHIRDLIQGMLLSPKGDYIMKTTRRKDGLYDVEIYASGPLLHTDTFKGKWPATFKGVAPGNINKKFFQALLQGELAAKNMAGLTSSPEQFEQLLGTLGVPSSDTQHTLSNSQLFPTQMLHYYLGSPLKNPEGETQSPAATHLLWKYKKLKEIAHEHVQEQTLKFATLERAQGLEIAASQLLTTAQSMQDLSPEIAAQIKSMEATYEEIHHAAGATWKRHSRDMRHQSANAPTAVQMPEIIKGQIRPHFARLKNSLDQAERRLSALPFAKNWSNAARKMILQKVFYMNDAEGAQVYETLQKQFPELETVPPPVRTAYQGKLRKVFEGLHLLASKVYQALGALYDLLHHALHTLFSFLPKSVTKRIGSLSLALRQWLEQTGKQIQEKIIGYMLAPIIRSLLDETLLHHLSSFGHYYISSMHEHATLSFEIPSTTKDGTYPATHFATQFFPLTGFASLDQITLTVEDHKITKLQLPGIETAFSRRENGLVVEFVHPELGMLAKQQHDPRLAAFSPYLILETSGGTKNVLIRESLAPEQLAGFISENTLGSFLWNGIKPLLGLGNAPGALHLCTLEDTLSSDDPKALLYIMRSYLMRNEEKLAYLIFKQFEQQVKAHPELMPQDLAKHLLPLTLAPSETAAKIRLALFAMLEDPSFDEARQQDPLYGLLWIVMSKDLNQASGALEDARFPKLKAEAPLLQQAMLSRMEEHLPFYTSEEMAELVKKLFSLRGTVSPGILKNILEKAVVNLQPAADALIPPNMQQPAKAPGGLMARAINAVVQNEISQLPTLIRESPHLIPKLVEHVPCTEEEADILENFFADHVPAPASSVLPQLTSKTLKSHFWLYYSAFYNECMYYDGVRRQPGPDLASALKLPLILLEQEVAADHEAAILVRLLTTLMKLSEDPSGDVLVRLERLHPDTLQHLLQDKDQGVDALVAQLKKLLAVPEQVKADETLSQSSFATQIGVGALSGYNSAMQTVSSAVQTAQNVQAQIHQKTAAFLATGAQYMQQFSQAFGSPEVIEDEEMLDDEIEHEGPEIEGVD